MPDVQYWTDRSARESLMEKGRVVLSQIREKLIGQEGVVAIEPESGTFFLGATLGQANDAAYKSYPDQWLYFVRLDDPTAEVVLPTW
jgi:hypothetical protein